MTKEEFDELEIGDMVRNDITQEIYFVKDKGFDHVAGTNTLELRWNSSNPMYRDVTEATAMNLFSSLKFKHFKATCNGIAGIKGIKVDLTVDAGGTISWDYPTEQEVEEFRNAINNSIKPKSCTCGAKHTSNPDKHSTWCDIK